MLGVFRERGKARMIDRVEPVTAMPKMSQSLITLLVLTHQSRKFMICVAVASGGEGDGSVFACPHKDQTSRNLSPAARAIDMGMSSSAVALNLPLACDRVT